MDAPGARDPAADAQRTFDLAHEEDGQARSPRTRREREDLRQTWHVTGRRIRVQHGETAAQLSGDAVVADVAELQPRGQEEVSCLLEGLPDVGGSIALGGAFESCTHVEDVDVEHRALADTPLGQDAQRTCGGTEGVWLEDHAIPVTRGTRRAVGELDDQRITERSEGVDPRSVQTLEVEEQVSISVGQPARFEGEESPAGHDQERLRRSTTPDEELGAAEPRQLDLLHRVDEGAVEFMYASPERLGPRERGARLEGDAHLALPAITRVPAGLHAGARHDADPAAAVALAVAGRPIGGRGIRDPAREGEWRAIDDDLARITHAGTSRTIGVGDADLLERCVGREGVRARIDARIETGVGRDIDPRILRRVDGEFGPRAASEQHRGDEQGSHSSSPRRSSSFCPRARRLSSPARRRSRRSRTRSTCRTPSALAASSASSSAPSSNAAGSSATLASSRSARTSSSVTETNVT